jgi:hypothetical protein
MVIEIYGLNITWQVTDPRSCKMFINYVQKYINSLSAPDFFSFCKKGENIQNKSNGDQFTPIAVSFS